MSLDPITYHMPPVQAEVMIIGLSGWMDAGEVSTGVIELICEKLTTSTFATVNPEGFYIYNFPGTMEVTALFRPHIQITDGLITEYQTPINVFFHAPEHKLLLFHGKEPNLRWKRFSKIIFEVAQQCRVRRIYFIGSVAGLVPHTREPRITASYSSLQLKEEMTSFNLLPVNYEGPASIVNELMIAATRDHVEMINLVAEIPAYVQGRNPKSIEAVARRLARLLNLDITLGGLHAVTEALDKKLDQLIQERPELAEHVRTLEENYDQELFNTEMGDLKKWLIQQGIRLD